jgi:hypothetical protein
MRCLLAAILFNSACASSGELVESDVIVPREGAKALAARFSMGAGELEIRGGDCELAQAKMRYDSASSVPRIDYAIDEQGFATLLVREHGGQSGRQSGGQSGRQSGRAARWTVCLTNGLPLELEIDLGAGDSRVELDRVQLRTLDINVGAGNVAVDLRNSILAGSKVAIDGGTGNVHLSVPSTVGVRVAADKGVGGLSADGLHEEGKVLVNDLWGKSDRAVDVQIDVGVGQINVTMQ